MVLDSLDTNPLRLVRELDGVKNSPGCEPNHTAKYTALHSLDANPLRLVILLYNYSHVNIIINKVNFS